MEKFHATKVNDKLIELAKSEDLERLCGFIEKEENFILEWNEDNAKKSQVFFGGNLMIKVKTGDLSLTALEKKN